MMQPKRPVGIVGFGTYIPRYRIAAKEIARIWTDGQGGVPVESKSVPGPDEDTITMSIEAARNALRRAQVPAERLSAVWVGSESHPYSVKPSGTLVAEAIGAQPWVSAADWEFACKAGSEALTAGMGMVGSGMADYVLSIEETATPKVPSRAQACARANVTPLRPGELEIDTFYATSVLSGSCGGENAPERLFHLSLPEEKTIQIELLDPEFDAVVYLRVECDDERSELNCVRAPKADASAEGEGGPSRTFAATIGPGEYTLGIDGQFENQMGAVRVRMTELPFSLPRGGR